MDDTRSRLEESLTGSYQIERELGGGGMSRTYLATELAYDRKVVVKVLAPDLRAGISVERFRREILTVAKLQHPHVVPVLASGDADGLPWFTMPYVDGDSLRHRLARGAPGIGEAVSVLRDVARALSYAHRNGIVHRDIKPDNVLLSSGSATVTDFGIAKAISAARTGGDEGSATLTQVGTSIGTPAYMSPEQALGDADTDHRTDIYAFGAMAYELLAGHPPFRGSSPSKLVAAHIGEIPRDVIELRPDCPPLLAELVMRCLEKDADHRPAQATDLVRVLDTVTSSESTASAPAILRGGRIPLGKAVALWAAGTASVAVMAWAATEVVGLPDWVFPGSLGVMLAGLPVILLTAYVQRTVHRTFVATPSRGSDDSQPHGTMATLALKASPHVSWRRAWLGGVAAVGSFTLLVAGFMILRALGIGPMGSLQGKGALGEQESLVVADFRSPSQDPELGTTVAEALRTDLAQSSVFRVLSRATLREMLGLMRRADEQAVTFELAREIATREGVKAVLDGSIARIGQGYVVSARLVSAMDGAELATFRQEAADDETLLPALGRLSRSVRERAGESLKSIRASSELERVTTPSLPALRKYVEGSRVYAEEGDADRAVVLLTEAVQLDTAFAMAWRRLAIVDWARGLDAERGLQALQTAYNHRDRLTAEERLLTEATYFSYGAANDPARAQDAYEELIRLDPGNSSAINNLAGLLASTRQFERTEELYRQVAEQSAPFGGAFTNLIQAQIWNGRPPAALDSTVAAFRARLPDNSQLWLAEFYAAIGSNDYERADSVLRAAHASATTLNSKVESAWKLADLLALHGKPAEALRWTIMGTTDLHATEPLARKDLEFVLDTAALVAFRTGDTRLVRTYVDRGLAQTPMQSLPRSQRPWTRLLQIAVDVQDSSLARYAADGYLQDYTGLWLRDSLSYRNYARGLQALASERWDEALPLLRNADADFLFEPSEGQRLQGLAHDGAGHPDSAIVYYERYIATPNTDPWYIGNYLPLTHRRLGELYEDRGDVRQAIRHYQAFVDFWQDAEPVFQPQVADARRRIQRLEAGAG